MKSENRVCQNCKKEFTIEPDDFGFYEKMKVPPPTFCSECRMIRRLIWRNMRGLHKRQCGLCQSSLISMFPDDGCPVFCIECFNGDNWDQYTHGKDIDWNTPFVSQIYELFKVQPRIYQIRAGRVVNSDYGTSVVDSKNSYMVFSSLNNEDVMYSENMDRCRNSVDSYAVEELDQCYWNITSSKNYNSHFIVSSYSCIDSLFLYDCANCHDCCLSSNLRNQEYVFKNKKLSKEEYEKEIAKLELDTYHGWSNAEKEFEKIYEEAIHKFAQITASQNAVGDFILNSKNVYKSFNVINESEDIRYGFRIIKAKQIFDCSICLTGELCYECVAPSVNGYNQVGSIFCLGSKNMLYSLFCRNCSDCFGCVGLRNSQYCILNKQYTKEEYLGLIEKIKKFMEEMKYKDENGRIYGYGEFLPFTFSPFNYNETILLDFFPISKDTAKEMDYPWAEKDKREYPDALKSSSLPDSVKLSDNSILNKIIACPNNGKSEFQCTGAYKIVANELQFLKSKNIPLPRFCPNCRHYQRFTYVNPLKLWFRKCMCNKRHSHHEKNCEIEFETSYAPNRPETIYCEKCYQQEVY